MRCRLLMPTHDPPPYPAQASRRDRERESWLIRLPAERLGAARMGLSSSPRPTTTVEACRQRHRTGVAGNAAPTKGAQHAGGRERAIMELK